MPTYYRVLDDAPDPNRPREQSTKRRWERGERRSTHNTCPGEWIVAWNNGSRNADEFPLRCEDGLHTTAARQAFLEAAGERIVLSAADLAAVSLRTGELDGICAFQQPDQAWTYVVGDHKTPASLQIVHMSWVVEFEGDDINVTIPESKRGGVLVVNPDAGQMYSAAAFAKKYGFELPPTDQREDIHLTYGEE